MCLISTYIDLNQEILVVKSPRCRDELPINLKPDSYNGGIDEIDLYGQR